MLGGRIHLGSGISVVLVIQAFQKLTMVGSLLKERKLFGLSYSYFLYFLRASVMITLVLYNLYISICEKRKAGFSLYLYAHQRRATKHFSETLWQTICSTAAMCLMWALDTKQTLIVGKRQLMFCQSLPAANDPDLPNSECLSLSGGSLCM